MGNRPGDTLILVNPNARKGKLGKEWPEWEPKVVSALREKSAQIVFTTSEERGSGLVRQALVSGAKKIVAVGGDGTLSEAVRGFFKDGKAINPDAVLFAIPAGRGDDFFKSLRSQQLIQVQPTLEDGIDIIKTGYPGRVDVGEYHWLDSEGQGPSYFINSVGFGFLGLLVDKIQKNAGLFGKSFFANGPWTYRLQGLAAIAQYRPLAMQIKVDGKTFFEGKVFFGNILNGRYSGAGICWDPQCRLDDGVLNVVLFQALDWLTMIKYAPQALQNSWDKVPGLLRAQGKQIEVRLLEDEVKSHPIFEIDGDTFEGSQTRGGAFSIVPQAIQIQNKMKS